MIWTNLQQSIIAICICIIIKQGVIKLPISGCQNTLVKGRENETSSCNKTMDKALSIRVEKLLFLYYLLRIVFNV